MLPIIAAVLAFVVATSPASSAAVQASAQDSTAASYIALGDSIAFGIGSSLPRNRGYPVRLQQLLSAHGHGEVELVNLAVPGETAATFMTNGQSDLFRDYMTAMAEAGQPIDLVTVTLGGNEMLTLQLSDAQTRQIALEAFRSNIQAVATFIRDLAGNDPELVFTTYYDLSSGDQLAEGSDAWWIEQFNAAIRDAAEAQQATVAEVGPAFDSQIDTLTHYPHDVHPNNQGYQAIADTIWTASGFDREAPEIKVLSEATSSRPTPTLRMLITDDTGVEGVVVTINGTTTQPHCVGDDVYVLLLDLRPAGDTPLEMIVEAYDVAGNITQLDHQVAFKPLLPETP